MVHSIEEVEITGQTSIPHLREHRAARYSEREKFSYLVISLVYILSALFTLAQKFCQHFDEDFQNPDK